MKNILDINISSLKKDDVFIESNYYILTVLNVGKTYNKGFNTYFKDVEFSVKTNTGRNLHNEIKSLSVN